MSKHSKNNTSRNIFTYGQRRALRNLYGTRAQPLSQHALKPLQNCSLCLALAIEPVVCAEGHLFCRFCIIQNLAMQSKQLKNQESLKKMYQNHKAKDQQLREKKQQQKKLKLFQQRQITQQVTPRLKYSFDGSSVGFYDDLSEKLDIKSQVWWNNQSKVLIQPKLKTSIICPSKPHPISIKTLFDMDLLLLQKLPHCHLCRRDLNRQQIGAWECGHLLCEKCKGGKCELCGKKGQWRKVEGTGSNFSSKGSAQVIKYTQPFIC